MQVDLVIAEWNANGISNHINEIELFLHNNFIDILLVSETHFTDKSYFRIKDYDLITANHPDNRAHAGAAVIIKSSIRYRVLESINELYLQAAGVELDYDNTKVSIYSVYFPPRHSVKCYQYENFFKKLGNKFIVSGDFNAKHTWWGSRLCNPKGRELFQCISQNHYNVLSTGSPTYWPTDINKTPDLLDFVVYYGIPPSLLHVVASEDLSSDHSPIIINFSARPCYKPEIRKLFTNRTDIKTFQEIVEGGINLNIEIKNGKQIDDVIENFTQLIHEAADISTPETNKRPSSYFITTEIKNLIRAKRRLRRIWHRTRNSRDKTNFNRSSNQLKLRLKELKNQNLKNFLSSLNTNNKNNENSLWNATKYLKRPKSRNVPIKTADGIWCRSDESKANAFKQHLEETFQPFSLCNNPHAKEILNFLDVSCQMDLPIKHFTIREIRSEIRKLNKKSPGYDLIDGRVLKSLPKKGLVLLTVIFNSILRLSYFPTRWKCAKITMVPKPGKPENSITSYRPISLLPVLSKLLEKLFRKRLSPILQSLCILPDHQFGFREGHGTPEQCHRVVNVIRDALEKKSYCSSVFLDVKQAFDRVWHQGLLYKLKHLLPTPFYLLLKSYLHERSFFVNINGIDSDVGKIAAGVPQGSVLGPVLYTIFTSDMPVSEDVTVATYADDTAILATSKCHLNASNKIQRQLSMMQEWYNKWNIKINAEKSGHVSFSLRKDECPPPTFNGAVIQSTSSVKYLGLHIDKRLTWNGHIRMKRQQLNIKTKRMHWLLGPKSALSLNNKVLLYKIILKPIWSYGIQLWGTASNSNVEILQRYQSKTLRLITGSPWFVNNFNIHNDLNVPFIKDEIKRFSNNYLNRLSNHSNVLAINLLDDSNEVRRLKRRHVLDLPFI